MKTNFKIIVVAIAIALTAVSCGKGSSVDAALSQIEKTMSKVEKNKTSMTETDWQALNDELEGPAQVLSVALESNDVSVAKKLKITAAMMRYATVISEAAMHTFADSLSVMSNQLQDAFENDEMKQALSEAFEGVEMEQVMEELQKAAEELQKLGK